MTEVHDDALSDMIRKIRAKLLGAQLLVGLKKMSLPSVDFDQAFAMAREAETCIRDGRLGYALIVGQVAA